VERSTKTTDKRRAEETLRKWLSESTARKTGVVDATLADIAEQGKRPIQDHLDDYVLKIRNSGKSEDYASEVRRMITEAIDAQGWTLITQINADSVNKYIEQLKRAKSPRMKKSVVSARTVCYCIGAVRSFTKWLVRGDKLVRDPLATFKLPSTDTDRRLTRRILLHEEWDWLRSATEQASTRHDMTGHERVLAYALAVQTGLRANEIRSLMPGQLFLDMTPPFVTCKAHSTKNKRPARLYIAPDLADALRIHVSTKSPKSPVFHMPHSTRVVEVLRSDLASARSAWLKASEHDPEEYARRVQSDFLASVNHDGDQLDFHALRHTCGAWRALAGDHPKVIQTIMRHASIELTMGTYGHLFPGQEAESIAKLPPMMKMMPDVLEATGTGGEISPPFPRPIQRRETISGATQRNEEEGLDEPKILSYNGLRDLARQDDPQGFIVCDSSGGAREASGVDTVSKAGRVFKTSGTSKGTTNDQNERGRRFRVVERALDHAAQRLRGRVSEAGGGGVRRVGTGRPYSRIAGQDRPLRDPHHGAGSRADRVCAGVHGDGFRRISAGDATAGGAARAPDHVPV